jgi:apolipoprotein N-acyltransferase
MMKGIFLAFISALLLILAFPLFDLGLLAWIALLPLFLALRDKNPGCAFGLGLFAGTVFFMGAGYWMNVVPGFQLEHFLLLGLYLGFYWGLFALALNFLQRHSPLPFVLMAPMLWVSLEYLRVQAGFLAAPWALLGHSQYRYLPVIQVSSLTGAYGVSCLIVLANAALAEGACFWLSSSLGRSQGKALRPWQGLLAALFVIALTLAYGYDTISHPGETRKISLTVIQSNIPQKIKWQAKHRRETVAKCIRLSRQAWENGSTSLIVWPETALTAPLQQDYQIFTSIFSLVQEIQTPLLFGCSHRPKFLPNESSETRLFNSVILISTQGAIKEAYHKMHLLPFAEYLPYQDIIPWPQWLAAKTDYFTPGQTYTLFPWAGTKFGVMICWENLFPNHFRQFVWEGARFMINPTNEAWFGETAAPYQILVASVFRAVENRVAVARAANTGISCFINPYGQITGRVEENNKCIFVEGYLTGQIPLASSQTFYTTYGDIFASSISVLTIAVLAAGIAKKIW